MTDFYDASGTSADSLPVPGTGNPDPRPVFGFGVPDVSPDVGSRPGANDGGHFFGQPPESDRSLYEQLGTVTD